MFINEKSDLIDNMKGLLSVLWIFLSLNYIFCDVLSNMNPVVLNEMVSGSAGGIAITQEFLLGAGLLLEITFVMILLARVLPYRFNRWTNIIAGLLLAVVQVASLLMGPSTLHYWFFSVIEIGGNLLVVWLAWKWRETEDRI